MSPADDDFEAPESSSRRKLARQAVDAMPGHVVAAFALVAFLFFHGLAGNVLRLAGHELAAIDFPLEVLADAAGSLVCTGLILRIKYRKK